MFKIINPQKKNNYYMPTKAYFGRDSVNILSKLLKGKKLSKTLFVIGKHTLNDKTIESLISKLGKLYPKEINKSDSNSINSLSLYIKKGKFDCIVAIGGGTILDSSKSANIIAVNGGKIEDYLISKKREIKKKGLFFIAIPTTAGTGSEVTPWSVAWSDKKYSFSSPFMFPDVAIVDPFLTDNCPAYVTATSGIDALCQAIEAFWNVHHNPISDKYALDSIKTILESLENAVNKPSKSSRNNMAWGSLNGGLAFSNTATTICHSVSYPITAHWGIAHGQATSITLPIFIEYTFPVLEKNRLIKILRAMKVKNTKDAADKIRKLMKATNLKSKLSELGISKEGIGLIVSEGFDPERAKNAPRIPSEEKLKAMLLSIY